MRAGPGARARGGASASALAGLRCVGIRDGKVTVCASVEGRGAGGRNDRREEGGGVGDLPGERRRLPSNHTCNRAVLGAGAPGGDGV